MQHEIDDGRGKTNPHKRFVKVRADHELDGRIVPLMFRDEDGEGARIDAVLDVRQAASLKAGGQGIRYTCRCKDHIILLFHDRDEWFIELDG